MDSRPPNGGETLVTRGSGSVLDDLGVKLSPEDRVKLLLLRQVSRVIVEKGLTQTQVGGILGVDQAKVSAIVRGKRDGFSVERLLKFVIVLGCDVDIEIGPSKTERGHVSIHASGVPATEREKVYA